jgi:hypothetical protein
MGTKPLSHNRHFVIIMDANSYLIMNGICYRAIRNTIILLLMSSLFTAARLVFQAIHRFFAMYIPPILLLSFRIWRLTELL